MNFNRIEREKLSYEDSIKFYVIDYEALDEEERKIMKKKNFIIAFL